MSDAFSDLASYRLDKASLDLEAAKVLLNSDLVKQSINRSYYAMFHAARALLAYDKFDSSKHSGIISYFNKHYIATGKIKVEIGKMLSSAELIRNKSDYDDFYIASREVAETQLGNAENFITEIKNFIKTTH